MRNCMKGSTTQKFHVLVCANKEGKKMSHVDDTSLNDCKNMLLNKNL